MARDGTQPFKGTIDDVRVYSYGLDAGGVGGLAAMGINRVPRATIEAASAKVQLPANTLALAATVTDPDSDALTIGWTAVSGPAAVSFVPADQSSTTAGFTKEGLYRLRLSVSDGTVAVTDDIVVYVYPENWDGTLAHMSYDSHFNDDSIWKYSAVVQGGPTISKPGKIGLVFIHKLVHGCRYP
jgi:hypothetical protein